MSSRRRQLWSTRRRGLVATLRLPAQQGKFFVRVLLWKTVEHMDRATGAEVIPGKMNCGMTITSIYDFTDERNYPTSRCIAEVHFSADTWDVGYVAHEFTHVTQHVQAMLGPDTQECESSLVNEEGLAYQVQDWIKKTYTWLWDNCPVRQGKLSPEVRRLL